MEKSISLSNLEKFNKEFNSSKTKKIARNALIRSDINNIAMDWNGFRTIDHTYSNIISNEMDKVTNQKASGRCWGFAGLNLMRIQLQKSTILKNLSFHKIILCFVIN